MHENRPRNVSIFYTDYLMRAISDENAQRSPPNVRRSSSETGALPGVLSSALSVSCAVVSGKILQRSPELRLAVPGEGR